MPGIAQVWLTDDELDAVVKQLPFAWSGDNPALVSAYTKLRAAREGVACPLPPKENA